MSSSPIKLSNFTINEILKHHEFINGVEKLVSEKAQILMGQAQPNPENIHLQPENSLIEELHQVIMNKIEHNAKKLMSVDLINVFAEVKKMKSYICEFVDQQNRFTANLSKQFHQRLEQIKPKNISESLDTLASNWGRSVYKLDAGNEKKGQSSVLEELESSTEEIRESFEKGENITALAEQFTDFKIQTKLAIESLKNQINKLDIHKKNTQRSVNSHFENSADQITKKTIKNHLTYVEQVSSMKKSIENIEQEIVTHQNQNNDYFSNQLKSIWLVINKIRDAQQAIAAHVFLKFDDFV